MKNKEDQSSWRSPSQALFVWYDKCAGTAEESSMASYRSELEKIEPEGIPSLENLEVGKPIGAILPMSEHAQVALRDSIELIDFLMNQDSVVWN
jgi:hypothetical protein